MKNANWIHSKDDMGDGVLSYKKEFQTLLPVRSVILYISARGVYEATLNGQRIGDFILAPGWTSYQHRIQYQKYDITDLVSEENSLVVTVAPGWYKGMIAKWWCKFRDHVCAFIAKIEITYVDGTVENIYTDREWKAALSGYDFCEIYDGFIYDARRNPDFCLETEVDKNNSKEELIEQVGKKIIEHERFKPKEIIKTPKGETVVDFGQNLAGYVEISLSAKAGDRVSLSFGEVLDQDGNFYNANYRGAKCQYVYICKDGQQTFKPTLTFYGYRYIRVNEFPGEVGAENVTSIAVYSDLKRTGYWMCRFCPALTIP